MTLVCSSRASLDKLLLGLEPAMGYYGLLDRTPMGRNEQGEDVCWLRRHDEYDTVPPM